MCDLAAFFLSPPFFSPFRGSILFCSPALGSKCTDTESPCDGEGPPFPPLPLPFLFPFFFCLVHAPAPHLALAVLQVNKQSGEALHSGQATLSPAIIPLSFFFFFFCPPSILLFCILPVLGVGVTIGNERHEREAGLASEALFFPLFAQDGTISRFWVIRAQRASKREEPYLCPPCSSSFLPFFFFFFLPSSFPYQCNQLSDGAPSSILARALSASGVSGCDLYLLFFPLSSCFLPAPPPFLLFGRIVCDLGLVCKVKVEFKLARKPRRN